MIAVWLATVALGAEIVVDGPVQQAVDRARPGDTVVLPEGDWPGPVVVDKPITLSSRGGVLVGGEGSTLRIEAAGVTVEGLVIRRSGDALTGPDACIYVAPTAVGTVIRDSALSDCLFGIWVHEGRGVHVEDNTVVGRPEAHPANKGNGIHLFDCEAVVVRGNTVSGARDGVYVSATEHSLIADNEVSNQRYGVHYMYSYDNTISGNIANHNSGGLALMGSHRLEVFDNVATDNQRQGVLFRDVQYSNIHDNHVARNGEGLFFFSSLDNTIAGNVVEHNQIGARIWAGTERNQVEGNAFVGNGQQVLFVSTVDDQPWGSNYWSDYLGWDQDADGYGDRPYRTDGFLSTLLHRYPQAVLLLRSPTLEILGHLQRTVPGLRAPSIVDDQPLMTWDR